MWRLRVQMMMEAVEADRLTAEKRGGADKIVSRKWRLRLRGKAAA